MPTRIRSAATTRSRGGSDVRAEQERQPKRSRAGRLASGGAIRDAATVLFLERGYDGTSMDDIAAAAQVSKQTIYTHFADKEALFAALVLANADRVEAFLSTMRSLLDDPPDIADALRQLARTYLRFVIRPQVLRLRRLVLAETARFPAVARAYYEKVPARVYATLAALLAALDAAHRLRIDDAERAAQHFAWLVLGPPLDRGMFENASAIAPSDDDADAAVDVFLSAYGVR